MYGPITVTDILKRPVFRDAHVVAGASGLNRHVTWVHILDVPEPQNLIRGGELVLSTGLGFVQRQHGFFQYVQQLIQGGATGLCVELGTAVSDIPQDVLDFAEMHQFPLIVFSTQVHFVDITQDIHRLILSRHHKLIDDLEGLSRKLQQLTVSAMGTSQMLQLIHESTRCTVMYARTGLRPVAVGTHTVNSSHLLAEWSTYFPMEADPLIEPEIRDIPDTCVTLRTFGDAVILQSAMVLGMPRGTFAMFVNRSQVDDYLLLMTDRVTNALSLDEFRRLSMEERQLFREADWVERMVRNDEAELPTFMKDARVRHKRFRVAVITCTDPMGMGTLSTPTATSSTTATDETDWVIRKTDLAMMMRLAFSKEGFRPYLSVRQDMTVAVLEWDNSTQSPKSKIESAVQQFKQALARSGLRSEMEVGVGHEVSATDLAASYKTAVMAWNIRRKAFPKEVHFYDDSGVYRWAPYLNNSDDAREWITMDIQKILEYDRKHHSDLLRTLKVYLDCDRSKQKTAEQLFIHRQTLYHRLKLLNQLLQVDLEDPVQRLGLHVSLYFFLYNNAFA
ncbi:PucR family transcriptional regulator [Alicyclobacillus pomorum]|uniref:PucR family transcriptional regulator n=1 Tax=Alicyclobacillus pomorum TaxID=204470 RepID=UPI00041E24BF|nr:PucR family transcriptional regulator [Alicyclobacillus pomorum]